MLKKFIICCTPVVILAMLAIPAFAGMTVSYPAITHSWPAMTDGSRLLLNTMTDGGAQATYGGDPNILVGLPDGSPPYQLVGENFANRANMETFTVPLDLNASPATPYGLTLTHLVITVTGGGSDSGQACSLHIYDLNQQGPFPVVATTGNYILVGDSPAGSASNGNNAMLAPGDYLVAGDNFIFQRDANATAPNRFIDFAFTGYESFDLEPNHLYTFEIWPTFGNDAGWNWIRGTANYLGGGLVYRVDPPADWRLLSTQRQADASGTRTAVLGVYGIPCEANAMHPIPRHLENNVLLDSTVSWTPGRKARWSGGTDSKIKHKVFLSTSESGVRNRGNAAKIAEINETNCPDMNRPFCSPTNSTMSLAANSLYYWRVDEFNNTDLTGPISGGGYGRGSTGYWVFKTSGPTAIQPSPINNAMNTEFKPIGAWLSWTRGCYTGSADTLAHQVYFGTNSAAVTSATTSTGTIYRGAVTDPCYPLKNLAPDYTLNSGVTYYWRVDEINATTATTYKGDTWNFTMPNPGYLLLDNFSYQSTTTTDMGGVWQTGYRLPYTPPSGCHCNSDQNNNGGTFTNVAGNVVMMQYDNSYGTAGPWSEMKLDYQSTGTGIDWTLGGAFVPKVLAVQFDGNGGNTLNSTSPNYDKLYMGLEDATGKLGVVYYDSDAYAAQRQICMTAGNAAVREWKVDLSTLTGPNSVDLTKINKVYLGIGSPRGGYNALYNGGTGWLRFTNLKLYVSHCNPQYPNISAVQGDLMGPLAGQFGGNNSRFNTPDCIVNINDMYFFAQDWLWAEPNSSYPSASNPGTANLTVYYAFDDNAGALIADSSGNGRDGTLYNSSPFTWAYAGHNGSGYSVNLEPGYHTWIQCPNTVVKNETGQTGQTFTFWMKYNDSVEEEHYWSSILVLHRNSPGETGGAGTDGQTMETQIPDPFTPGQLAMPWLRWVDMRVSKETGVQHQRASMVSSRWNHFALVYDTSINPDPNLSPSMSMYVNGVLVGRTADGNIARVWGPNDTGDGNANSVRIGTRSNAFPAAFNPGQFWQGRLDDMRLYNRALTLNEVQYLATDGTGARNMQAVFIEPDDWAKTTVSSSFLGGQPVQIVNFNDFAYLANRWLNQQLWP